MTDIAQHELELENAPLLLTDPESSDDSMKLEITAPIDGRVLRGNQESAAVVTAGAALMEIGDPRDLEVVSNVLSRAAVGDNFRVECPIVVWEAEQVLRTPTRALFRVGDSWTVFVVRDETAVETRIEVGHDNGRLAEVTGGFAAGDRVVVHPSDRLRDGSRIAVR